ncbi:spore germination protein [Orenia marismortui]|uniref:Stage V sporulation protein AF n=1 Tax=Orenia marismortui TaxID=46469 RepID=A0A4R8H8K6_9FIRM|nr:spore germination protein [Orenia marismortui]TDX51167.1 stage V sporulation protein AF [Orenia marismortui]
MDKKKKISKELGENLQVIKDIVDGPKTFDFINRDFKIANKDVSLIFIDGLTNGSLINKIMEYLMDTKPEDLSVDVVKKLLEKRITIHEVAIVDNIDDLMNEVLAGPQALLIDGEEKAIIIDARTWMSRGPAEPELEKSTRGPEDGFIETMLFNLQMIRRRIRDPKLRAEALRAGKRSQNDIAVVYIEDIADPELVKDVKDKIKDIDVDGLPLADRTVEDFLTRNTWNPLPTVRYSNRPDVITSSILEGKVCVIVDNSPTALILPATFFDHTQNIEEYRQSPLPGTYLTLLRFAAVLLSLILPPLWLVLAYGPEWLPKSLDFIGVREMGKIPIGIQFILASFGIDLVRMASIQTPSSLATSLGLIGALMLGEFAVKVGVFSTETIFYMAIAGISNFTIPGFEFALTIKILRLGLIVLVIYFKLAGLIGGIILIFLLFAMSNSFGTPYLWPLIPFNAKALKSYLIRQSILNLSDRRPNIRRSKDADRLSDE